MYLNTFSTTPNFFATMSGDETAELVITKEKTKEGKPASRTSFIFSILHINRTGMWNRLTLHCTNV